MAAKFELILQAKDEFSSVFSKIGKNLPSLKTSVLAVSAAFAATSVAAFALTKSVAASDDAVTKMSLRLGVASEALSAYQFAAELSGVKNSELNTSWQMMSRNISEAAQGVGTATDAFEMLGIKSADIISLSPDKQFEAIAEAMQGVELSADKMSTAMDIFGRSGGGMIQIMSAGRDGLEAMKQEASDFGVVVSGEAAQAAAEFNDSMTRMTASLKGIGRSIAGELMPVFTVMANAFAQFASENREDILKFAIDSASAIGNFIFNTADNLSFLINAFDGMRIIWTSLQLVFFEFSQAVWDGLQLINDGLISTMEALNIGGVFDEMIAGAQTNAEVIAEIQGTLNDTLAEKNAALTELLTQDYAGRTEAFQESMEAQREAFNSLIDDQIAKQQEAAELSAEIDAEKTEAKLAKTEEEIAAMQELRLQERLTNEEMAAEWDEADFETQLANDIRAIDAAQKQKDALVAIQQAEFDARLGAMNDFSNNMITASQTFGRTMFEIGKAAAIATAIIETISGAQKAFNSLAAIPIIGTVLGGVAAAAAILAGMARVNQIRSTSYTAAHGGIDHVPAEQTMLLAQGERVLSPRQNVDLTDFLSGRGDEVTGGAPVEVDIHILENATNVESMLAISPTDWIEIVQDSILPAVRTLEARGITA